MFAVGLTGSGFPLLHFLPDGVEAFASHLNGLIQFPLLLVGGIGLAFQVIRVRALVGGLGPLAGRAISGNTNGGADALRQRRQFKPQLLCRFRLGSNSGQRSI